MRVVTSIKAESKFGSIGFHSLSRFGLIHMTRIDMENFKLFLVWTFTDNKRSSSMRRDPTFLAPKNEEKKWKEEPEVDE